MKKVLLTAAGAVVAMAFASTPALAASTVFYATFEDVPGAPGYGDYTTVGTADGFTGTSGIELQNHVAGSPAADGGNVFVELDTYENSTMSRAIGAGSYVLSFLYSPRPGFGPETNGIDVLLNGVSLGSVTGTGGNDTAFTTITRKFNATVGSTLSFAAIGTSDGVGGYIDNIKVTAVPEPATWALMIVGFGMVGAAMRRRAATTAITHSFA